MNSNLCEIFSHVNRVADLIERRATGPRKEFARRLGISERSLDNLISQFRKLGAPVSYCHYSRTYFFKYPVDFRLGIYPIPDINRE